MTFRLNPRDRDAPVIPWDQTDPYLAAKVEMERQMTIRAREYAGLSYEEAHSPEVHWWETDPHLLAFRKASALGHNLLDDDSRAQFALDAERKHAEWVKDQDRDREIVELSDTIGKEVSDEMRARVSEPDRYHQAEEMREELVARRRRTLANVARVGK